MDLLVGFYQDRDPARTAEFVECVRRNAENPHIARITVFLEDAITSTDASRLYAELAHPKVTLVEHGVRLTFACLLAHASQHLAGKAVAIANADIFFDDTLALLDGGPPRHSMLCLSRWDERLDGSVEHFDRPYSQDAWIFLAPVPAIAADFCLGIPRCDGRFAYEAERAGLTISNPSRSVRARHLHNSSIHRYTQRDRVNGPVRHVRSSFLDARTPLPEPSSRPRSFPSHRGQRAAALVEARLSEVETALAPFFGDALPDSLRGELRRSVASSIQTPERPNGAALAVVAFRESMGYTVATLENGVSTHNNDRRPLVSVPKVLMGLRFTQVVANHAAPVEVEFRTAGKLFALAAPGWDGYAPSKAFLDDVGWREPIEPLHTADGTRFDVWSLAADAGERLCFPTQVMLASEDLVKLA